MENFDQDNDSYGVEDAESEPANSALDGLEHTGLESVESKQLDSEINENAVHGMQEEGVRGKIRISSRDTIAIRYKSTVFKSISLFHASFTFKGFIAGFPCNHLQKLCKHVPRKVP